MEKHRWTKEEIAGYRKEHGEFGYRNRMDTNIIVPKAFGLGFTFNWANPWTWVCVAALIAAIICIKALT